MLPGLLLRWAGENIGISEVTVDNIRIYCERGSLYDGPACMCFRRWGFWIQRLEDIAKDEESGIGDEIRKSALETAKTIRTAEGAVGYTLADN